MSSSPSSTGQQSWKRQLFGGLITAALLGISYALPAELASTDGLASSAKLAPEITEARVSQVKTSASNKLGTACVSHSYSLISSRHQPAKITLSLMSV